MIYNILLIIQIIVALSIIGLVLIQHGKGADAGAAFGGGSSGTVFGSAGAGNFLSRSTAVLAAVFFANSLALAWIVSHSTGEAGSLVDSVAPTPTTKVEVPVSDVPGGTVPPDKMKTAPVVNDVPVGDVPTKSDIPVAPQQPSASRPVNDAKNEVLPTPEIQGSAIKSPASNDVPTANTENNPTKPDAPVVPQQPNVSEPKPKSANNAVDVSAPSKTDTKTEPVSITSPATVDKQKPATAEDVPQ